MKYHSVLLLVLLSLCANSEEYPGSWTTADLMDLCAGKKISDKDQCAAFIAGVRAGAVGQRLFMANQMTQTLKTKGPAEMSKTLLHLLSNEPYCPKGDLSEKEVINAVTKFISKVETTTPELLEGGAGTSVLLAMYRTFSCDPGS